MVWEELRVESTRTELIVIPDGGFFAQNIKQDCSQYKKCIGNSDDHIKRKVGVYTNI